MTWYNAMYEIKYVRLHRSQKENNIQVTDDAYKQVKPKLYVKGRRSNNGFKKGKKYGVP